MQLEIAVIYCIKAVQSLAKMWLLKIPTPAQRFFFSETLVLGFVVLFAELKNGLLKEDTMMRIVENLFDEFHRGINWQWPDGRSMIFSTDNILVHNQVHLGWFCFNGLIPLIRL